MRCLPFPRRDRKSTRLNSSHTVISYAVFCLKKKNTAFKSSVSHSYHYNKGTRISLTACVWNLTGLPSKVMRSLAASFFFFNDTATTEIYTLSLHDALPI